MARIKYKSMLMWLWIFLVCSVSLFPEEIQVSAAIEKYDMYMGESFIYQITIQGVKQPEEPEITGFNDFTVSFLRGFDNSSRSITIINGKQTVHEESSYVFQYDLIPQRSGTLHIPTIMVKVQGQSFMTESFSVTVREPREVSDYKLRLRLPRTTCYVGEKINLTVAWYWGLDAKGPVDYNIPIFRDPGFDVITPAFTRDPSKEYVTLAVDNEQFNAEFGVGKLKGKEYQILSFIKILVPKKPGVYTFNPATVSFQGITGYERVRDFFGREYDRAKYGRIVIPSNSLSLTIKSIPETGKPANYTGLIGNYTVNVSAAPLKIRVGDPITLTITLTGDGYLDDAKLPPLHEIPELAELFKIPHDIAPGDVQGNKVIFMQTFRAVSDDVKEIPRIKIPYFNAKTGGFDYAVTQPIPIEVEPATNELSILDMEGKDPIELKRELEILEEGIAHNYEGYDVLNNQAYGLGSFLRNPLFILLLVFPVLSYLSLLYIFRFSPLVRRNTYADQVKKALTHLKEFLEQKEETPIPGEEEGNSSTVVARILEVLKEYLGAKLQSKPGSLTFKDIEKPLLTHGVPVATVKELKSVFETCEARHYAGGAFSGEDISGLKQQILAITSEIERSFA
jgi:hypothetical protein